LKTKQLAHCGLKVRLVARRLNKKPRFTLRRSYNGIKHTANVSEIKGSHLEEHHYHPVGIVCNLPHMILAMTAKAR
jgi:hypothetical protein